MTKVTRSYWVDRTAAHPGTALSGYGMVQAPVAVTTPPVALYEMV